MVAIVTCALVIGEALVDVIAGDPHPGGSPVNVAVGLARLGTEVELRTRIGRDDYGRLLADHLSRAGVTLAPGSVDDLPTSTATVTVDGAGAARYVFDVHWDVAAATADGVDLVHVGSIGVYLEPGATAVAAALADVPEGTLVSFDPNIRPALLGTRADAVAHTEGIAALCHVVKLSDEDAFWLYPGEPLEDVLRRFAGLGARIAVITRGARGCLALIGSELIELPGRTVVVADTVGAGDAFMSGLLAALTVNGCAREVAARPGALDGLGGSAADRSGECGDHRLTPGREPAVAGRAHAAARLIGLHAVPNRELMRTLRRAVHAPFGIPAWRFMLEPAMLVLGTETELVLKSRWVAPQVLLDAGYVFRFPEIEGAVQDIVRR
ncbi:PfkB family carbohydrate kinase [Microbacterium sp. ASV81]|uniref:PfkB family carbohydrate kinase n=1 Tax=Microbacterium capsulatum TaxID=3041921 RepID=A0ABU0XG56_9MICO|nr:PfkB family carbohydrate kinase [Microbacterium sp. ASV81]MDQ4213877.1 PfkB family carbohydrate kinase [Microbacterium sp. ASV81]